MPLLALGSGYNSPPKPPSKIKRLSLSRLHLKLLQPRFPGQFFGQRNGKMLRINTHALVPAQALHTGRAVGQDRGPAFFRHRFH